MKTRSLAKLAATACAIAVLSPVYLRADEPQQKQPAVKGDLAAPAKQGQTVQAPEKIQTYITREHKITYITGSYIPREVKRVGLIQDSPYHVTVYDRAYIQRTGAQTVGQILSGDPAIIVRGRR